MRARHYWKIGSRKWHHWPNDHLTFFSPSDNNSFRLHTTTSIRIVCDEVKLCVIKKVTWLISISLCRKKSPTARVMYGLLNSAYIPISWGDLNPLSPLQWAWQNLGNMALFELRTLQQVYSSHMRIHLRKWQSDRAINRVIYYVLTILAISWCTYSSSAMFRAVGKIWSQVRCPTTETSPSGNIKERLKVYLPVSKHEQGIPPFQTIQTPHNGFVPKLAAGVMWDAM